MCVGCAGYIYIAGTLKPNIGIRASRHFGEVEENDGKNDRGSFGRFKAEVEAIKQEVQRLRC